jgi:hypothetical protein
MSGIVSLHFIMFTVPDRVAGCKLHFGRNFKIHFFLIAGALQHKFSQRGIAY